MPRPKRLPYQSSYLFFKQPKFVRYLIIGGITNLADIGIYSILLLFGRYYLLSSMFASGVSVCMNFFLHRRFTFSSKGEKKKQIPRFIVLLIINYFVTQAVLYILVDLLAVNELYAKVGSLLFVISYNFICLNGWVFRKSIK